MDFTAIIPARYASTRFPAKPLAILGGKPIIQHVYERVSKIVPSLCVATDDERIMQAVNDFGGKAVMTSTSHRSGTDRCYEAYCKTRNHANVIINVQGDEPFIAEEQLKAIMSCFSDPSTQIATLAKPFAPSASYEEVGNPNSPKIVLDNNGFALYFSRSVIPYLRDTERTEWPAHHTFLKHIGLYAYRAETLKTIASIPQGELEQCESLEQLRWLQAGLRIKVGMTNTETIGIDTPDDLRRAEAFLNR